LSDASRASQPAALEVRGLSKLFGDSLGVFDVNLRVERGTIHGFLGPNGSGKTTTIKCVMGLLRKTSGEIMFFGEKVRGEATQLRMRTGYLPELPCYPVYLKGREVLVTYGRMREVSDRGELKDEARALLNEVGLADASELAVGKYSRGMQTRLGLAVSMLGRPDLLVLDEPTSGLDPIGVKEVREMLKRLVSEGRTVLLSSHQLSEVHQMCGEVTVVNRGRTVSQGTVGDLAKRLRGGVVYRAEFDILGPGLMDELKGTQGVMEVRVIRDGLVRMLLSEDYDIRPRLARTATEYGSLLLTCEKEEASLEELFMSLVKEGEPGDYRP